jgi:alanine racemase
MRIGVGAIGYGDGYPRHARNGTPVLVNGRRAPLVGHVSMDMITIDLSGNDDARVGDCVTLWGEGLPIEEVAPWADSIPYQLICGVTDRVIGRVE